MREWKECRLMDVVVFQRGHDLPKTEMTIGSVPVAGSNGIIGYHNIATTKGPGITIGRSGNIGTPKYYKNDFWAHNTVLYVKDFNGNDELFSFYFLHTFDFTGFNAGSAVPTLNRNHIHEIPVLLPPLPEQKAIAGVLSSLDDKIDLLHRQNKTLEGMAEALWRKMFVEDADESWVKCKLSDEFNITMGQSPAGSSYNEAGIGTVFFQGRAEFDFRYPQKRLYTTEPKRFANQFDTLVSVRAPVGDINMASEDCCIGRGLASVRHNKGFISYTFYKISSLKDEFGTFEQQGTVFGSMGKDDFNGIETFIPDEDVIKKYEQTAKPLDDKIFDNSLQINKLTKMRDSLLPKLMSGEVRVKL